MASEFQASSSGNGQVQPRAADEKSENRDPAYFHYYAQFVHQQNMLQDSVRTAAYQSAILMNAATMFKDKLVADIGAGSGILSYFAVQAGASKVYAVEASNMAQKITKMLRYASTRNTWLEGKMEVVGSKVEDASIPKVDTLISEPIGVLLVHERMIESYLVARDRFLKPGGAMIPSSGTIFLAPFTDATLWTQTMAKVRFWEQSNFYGVDFSPLSLDARDEIFGQPVVGNFDPRILLDAPVSHSVNFHTISIPELQDIVIPIEWRVPYTGLIHGIAGWFDIDLGGHILSTAPQAERTHWQQVRFMLKEPIAANAFTLVKGWMRLTVNASRSYDITAELYCGENAMVTDPRATPMSDAEFAALRKTEAGVGARRGKWALHEQTYVYDQSLDYSKPEFLAMYTPEDMNLTSVLSQQSQQQQNESIMSISDSALNIESNMEFDSTL
ncbi:S-adenosyl-L-methionine-dependent methyltransferase [Phlyctochytrium arcticum]|nr:S-adenosyl-L-methionine-dependent methyltransferase [Phlyctochytrium arcticum]